MDPNFVGSGYGFDHEGNLVQVRESNQWDLNGHYMNLVTDPLFYQSDVDPRGFSPNTILNSEPLVSSSAAAVTVMDPSLEEDTDFSETFKFISQILMEENFEQKPCMCYDPLSLQHTEQSFYDALELEPTLPLSPNQHPLESPDWNSSNSTSDYANSHDLKPPSPDTPVSGGGGDASLSSSHAPSLLVPPHALTKINDGTLDLDSSVTKLLAENIFSDADSMLQFRRGLEEASKFLPQRPQLFTGLESTTAAAEPKGKATVEVENARGVKSRKNHARQDEEEGRSNKQSAVCVEDESEISEIFDRVLLSVENVPLCAEQKNGPVAMGDSSAKLSEQPHLFDGGKGRSKKQGRKKETVDLRTLLVLCAQALSASDNRTANELLKQVRQHSSALGDASQRLAHYVVNALEARLVGAGTGTQIFYMSHKKFTTTDYLKAYQVFISACPFKKFAHFFANKMILKTAERHKHFILLILVSCMVSSGQFLSGFYHLEVVGLPSCASQE
ncbi:Scarecrow protein 14 [Spatholobus suberectus]|nr:Scarecrow protein 14 [Spatholobus suberectus]